MAVGVGDDTHMVVGRVCGRCGTLHPCIPHSPVMMVYDGDIVACCVCL